VDLADWVPFFTAAAGASAALVGLLIVAMSVNVEAIVAIPSMPSRAAATISSLTVVVVMSVFGLVPAIGVLWFGVVVVVCTLGAGAFAVDAARRLLKDTRGHAEVVHPAERLGRPFAAVLPLVVTLLAGVLLLLGLATAGLVLIAVGFALVFIIAVVNTWVILIEIRR